MDTHMTCVESIYKLGVSCYLAVFGSLCIYINKYVLYISVYNVCMFHSIEFHCIALHYTTLHTCMYRRTDGQMHRRMDRPTHNA